MPVAPEVNEGKYRAMRLAVQGLGSDFGTVTTSAEAGTLSDLMGVVTTNALDVAAAGAETIVLTNTKAAVGDVCFANIIGGTTAGTPVLLKSVVTANTITFTIKNDHASAAFDGTVIIGYMLVKNLTGLPPTS